MTTNQVADNPKSDRIQKTNKDRSAAVSGMIDSIVMKLDSFQAGKGLGSLCIGVISANERVGVSTVSARLAIQIAQNGMGNVLLIDANSSRPIQHRLLDVTRGPGIVDHLVKGQDLENCLRETDVQDLTLLQWGSKIHASAVSPMQLKDLFADLRTRYQYVIVDAPVIDGVGFGLFAMNQTDGVVMVLDHLNSRSRTSMEVIHLMREHNIEVIGAILNRFVPVIPKWLRRWF